ncbi:hypothetical protein [Minwuia thermotolerans]|uniref:DUF4268 domain-containing protein n=1 Tax=Minwuia thermotolerans TaxID=2056226 RepID=A0A2M9FXX7_9PROT|nr:hypothetical protein [Minwuia thermotolerans]PJK28318.1 hypothetical protein CVT23_18280 [Minwuia thermotolerans]
MTELGELREVGLREAWEHEAHSFTPWLCDNLGALGDEVGLTLELVRREAPVQQYSADILARSAADDSLVLIENQLEGSDHRHLGQIMTYLAGLDAQTVIWVAARFEEPHVSAIKWLNEHTPEPFAFFAVQVKVVRIGDSLPAPLFDVLVRPNHWERRLQAEAAEAPTELGQFRRDFWTHVIERHPEAWEGVLPSASSSRHWWDDHWEVFIALFVSKQRVGVFLRGRRGARAEETAAFLEPHAEWLASRLGVDMGGEGRQQFFTTRLEADVTDRTQWDRLADWLTATAERYWPVVEELHADDANSGGESR